MCKGTGVFYREGRRDAHGIQEAMETRKLEDWVNPIHEACEVMVREFYANTRCDDKENKPNPPTYTSWFGGNEIK